MGIKPKGGAGAVVNDLHYMRTRLNVAIDRNSETITTTCAAELSEDVSYRNLLHKYME